jgi:hypothetical protein
MLERSRVMLVLCLGFGAGRVAEAQVPADSAALSRLTQRLDSLEAGSCPAGPGVSISLKPTGVPATDSLARGLDRLSQRLERLIAARCAPQTAAASDTTAVSDDLAALRAAADSAAGKPPGEKRDTTPVEPTKFVGRQRNGSAMNPEISATGDIRLIAHKSPDPLEGDAREFEVALQSTLDPYSNAKIILSFENDAVGVEEGYLYWTGLPGRVRLDAGLFREQVGDLNRWHLHALPESEYPLVYRRYLGADGLSGAGVSLYTALPVSLFHGTHEIWLQGTTAESDPLFQTDHHGTWLGRLQNFWQLSRSTYGQIGFTTLGGENSDSSLKSRVMGLDLRLTWRPPNAGTRQNLTFRAEGYQFHADDAGGMSTRYGTYADLNYQASQRWIFGARYDYVETPRGPLSKEWAVIPTITWWESEFVYLRLEGQHNHDDVAGDDNRVLLQAVFAMGPHKHETY